MKSYLKPIVITMLAAMPLLFSACGIEYQPKIRTTDNISIESTEKFEGEDVKMLNKDLESKVAYINTFDNDITHDSSTYAAQTSTIEEAAKIANEIQRRAYHNPTNTTTVEIAKSAYDNISEISASPLVISMQRNRAFIELQYIPAEKHIDAWSYVPMNNIEKNTTGGTIQYNSRHLNIAKYQYDPDQKQWNKEDEFSKVVLPKDNLYFSELNKRED